MDRMFVQFVALCYYEYLSEQLCQLKQTLVEEICSNSDGSQVLKTKKKLFSWLKNTPVYLTFQWFEVVEEVKLSSKLLSKRWTTEITKRNRMFLDKLGVPAF